MQPTHSCSPSMITLSLLALCATSCKSVESIDMLISSYVSRAATQVAAEDATVGGPSDPTLGPGTPDMAPYPGEFDGDVAGDDVFTDEAVYEDGIGTTELAAAAPASKPRGPVAFATQVDRQLVGTWEWSDGYTNSSAGFSGAVSVRLALRADGTFVRSSSAGAGSASGSAFSSGGGTPGRWQAVNGVLTLVTAEGTSQTNYTFHDGALVFGTRGNYRFWYRRG